MVYEDYGPPEVVRLQEVETPVPKANEIRIRTCATTVSSADCRLRSLTVPLGFGWLSRLAFGLSRPRRQILGMEIAGEVESIGERVSKFKVGDRVFAFCDSAMACHAEYKCVSEDGPLALVPPNLGYGEAAALSFGGTTALDFFRRGRLARGERVLVNGASGAVGTAAVQLARYFGAEVTGVCSGANVELVAALGASRVIDYTREDFMNNGETYDLIVDTVGTAPFARSRHSLKPGGRLLMVLGNLPQMLAIPWRSISSGKRIIAGPATGRAEDLRFLARLAETGEYKPVIDRRYPFEQIAAAHRYVDSGRKRGNVVITLDSSE